MRLARRQRPAPGGGPAPPRPDPEAVSGSAEARYFAGPEPHYGAYGYVELYQALEELRADLYPERHRRLRAEIAARPLPARDVLEACYYRLSAERWPGEAAALRRQIEAAGGFSSTPAPTVTGENRYRTFWRRTVAWALDSALPGAPLVGGVSAAAEMLPLPALCGVATLALALFLAYRVVLSRAGGTLGQRFAAIAIVDEGGERANLGRLLRREWPAVLLAAGIAATGFAAIELDPQTVRLPLLAVALAAAGIVWGALDVVSAAFRHGRYSFADRTSHTRVARTR